MQSNNLTLRREQELAAAAALATDANTAAAECLGTDCELEDALVADRLDSEPEFLVEVVADSRSLPGVSPAAAEDVKAH